MANLVFTRTLLLSVPDELLRSMDEETFKLKFIAEPKAINYEYEGQLGSIVPIVMTEAMFIVPEMQLALDIQTEVC